MATERTKVLEIALETLKELGEDLDKQELIDANEQTRLFGARSSLDSMNLVNFIADFEERLSDDLGIEVAIANQAAMSRTHSPFRRVGTCVDYVMEQLQKEST